MADGLTTTTTVATIPNATKIATDDAGAAGHVQMVKLAVATDGSATADTSLSSIDSKITAVDTGAVVVSSSALPSGAATEATLGGVLTSANFAAAFGTAGTADAQVMSVQGIASMTPVQVTVNSQVPGTGATNLGKAEDGAHASGDVGVMLLGVRTDTPNAALSDTNADYTPIAVTSAGFVRHASPSEDFAALANGPQVKKYYTNAGAVTDGIVWSPAAGKRWYVTDIFVGVSAACTVTFEDDKAGGDEAIFKMEFAANSGWSHGFQTPWFSGEDAADLLVTTTAGNIYITITGYEI
jgi:hypothetical protein